jgi:predicted secreted Zn-dependent protease
MTPQSRILSAVLSGVIFLSVPQLASAETVISKSFSYFKVGGKTAEDLDRELSRHGPMTKSTGARHPGATEIKFGGEITYVEKGSLCAVGTVKVTLHTKILLPQWTNRRRTTANLALIWDTLSADIKRHEERHAEISRGYARSLDKQLQSLRPQKTCEQMQALVTRTTQSAMDEHDKDQLRFDMVESKNFDSRMTRLLKNRISQKTSGR